MGVLQKSRGWHWDFGLGTIQIGITSSKIYGEGNRDKSKKIVPKRAEHDKRYQYLATSGG